MMKPVLTLIVTGTLLAGCATRTPYVRPAAPLPGAFLHQSPAPQQSPRTDTWWQSFGDPALDALVELAVARNPDLAAAAIRVRRAQLEARLAGNALTPIPSGSLSTGLSRPLSGGARRTSEIAAGSAGLAWEADLFGRLGARRDAARLEAEATAEDRDGVFLTLVGTTASLYWQIALANERIALGEQSLAYARRTQALVEARFRAGAVSTLERREVEQSVIAQEAALTEVRQARVRAREALMVLLDGLPAPAAEPQALKMVPLPVVAAGLPADLLGRRPDLRAAELRLRRVLASADATRASFYPALTLTGSLGTSSSGLLNMMANPVATLGAGLTLPFLNLRAAELRLRRVLASADATRASFYPALTLTGSLGTSSSGLLNMMANPVATLGAGLTLPFLNLRGMRFETQIARTRYEEAVILFRKSLYTALAEVETTLSARSELAIQGLALRRARDAAVDAQRLYEVRYRAGAVALRVWLDARERQRIAELALSANQFIRLQNQLTLYQALGGGFGN